MHSTQGLVRGGVTVGAFSMNGGAFHGREPDERRTDVDLGRLDSSAAQLAVARGRWSGQVSRAWLTRPERLSTYDAERHTASLAYEWRDGERSLAWMAAAGQNRKVHGNLDAFLIEATSRCSARHAVYVRAEQVAKDILDAGFHPVGAGHTHRQSNVGALTTGAVRDVVSGRHGRFGVGGDVTVYRVPANRRDAYGRPALLRHGVGHEARVQTRPHGHHHVLTAAMLVAHGRGHRPGNRRLERA